MNQPPTHPLNDPREGILVQGTYWIDKDLVRHELTEMDAEYLGNVCDFLRAYAFTLYVDHIENQASPEEQARWDDMDANECFEQARSWMVDQPLYRALRAELLRAYRQGR